MQVTEQGITLRGRVKVVVEENGVETVHHIKDNIIVNIARECLCHLITAPQTNRHITKAYFGTQGHTGQDILNPKAPLITDSKLTDTAPFIKNISGFNLMPETGTKTSVDFNITLEKTEGNTTGANGKAYTEAALYTAGGHIFARETFPAIVKTDSRRITFVWSILF